MKIAILLMYYERPNMVRFALDSIAAQEYENFEVLVVDDGSVTPIESVISNYPFSGKCFYFNTGDSLERKLERGASQFGKSLNSAIRWSNSDITIMLCDDDALAPGYLQKLNDYYQSNFTKYSYGHVLTYDPYKAKNYHSIRPRYDTFLNGNNQPINPFCRVDASQVSWRTEDFVKSHIEFPFPQTAALDAEVYRQMYEAWGPCPFNGMFTQYKGIFRDQLGSRGDLLALPKDKEFYDTSV